MAKRTKTTIQRIGLDNIDFDDEPPAVKVKYETEDVSDAINYEHGTQDIKIEPDVEYDYSEYQDDDENAEFVITELDDPDMLDLKPFKKTERKPPTSSTSSNAKYHCNVCGKGFAYNRSYHQHRMVHILRTDHTTCEICGKELKRTALDYHMKFRHIEARNYQCEVCLNRFKSPGALRHHIATFHPREGIECDSCERVFKTRDQLRKHKDEEHGESKMIVFWGERN